MGSRSPLLLGFGIALLLLGLGPAATATPLGLIPGEPDIISGFLTIDYDATSDALSISGFALEWDDGTPPNDAIAGGGFSLAASIDDSGVLASGGTLTITGTIASLGFNSGTLLTGDLTALGFPAGAGVLEFLFSVTGGDAAGDFGATGGVIVGIPNGFSGSFASDFGEPFSGVSDTFAVPEPGAAALLGVLFAGSIARRRR